MQNKKKQRVYIAIIVISLGAAGWLLYGSFGGGSISPAATGIDDPLDLQLDAEEGSFSNVTLPYGTTFDLSLFSDERFLELTAQPRVIVSENELGKPNAFLP